MADGPCQHCMVEQSILELFGSRAKVGSAGAWIDGIIDAAAQIAAVQAMPGKETAVRDKCAARFLKTFDLALSIALSNAAKEATAQ